MLQNGGKSGIINGEKGESESQKLREELARDVLSLTDEQAAAVLLGFFLMIYVVLDARNPNMGLFRRQEISPIVYVAAFSIVLVLFAIAHALIKQKVGDKHADDTH